MSPWLALVVLAVFLIGLTKSGFGSGAGLMIVPMTAIAMRHLPAGAEAALPLLLPLLIVGDLVAIWQYRAHASARIITRLLPGTVVGIVLGSLLLRWFANQRDLAEALINVEIGLESVVLVSITWYREWRSRHGVPPYRPSILKSTAVGTFAGTSSTLAHAAGPIVALHLLPQRLERRLRRHLRPLLLPRQHRQAPRLLRHRPLRPALPRLLPPLPPPRPPGRPVRPLAQPPHPRHTLHPRRLRRHLRPGHLPPPPRHHHPPPSPAPASNLIEFAVTPAPTSSPADFGARP